MNDKAWFWTLLIGVIYIAILYVLVKPGSAGASAVQAFSKALADLVTTATGGVPASGGNRILGTG
jgi:hypothetical protein